MKNTTIAKKMYICAINYYDAYIKLANGILDDKNPSIIYPVIYLQRHTFELLLKSLILSSVQKQDVSNLTINIYNEGSFNLGQSHSLAVLFKKYIDIQSKYKLVIDIDKNFLRDIEKIVKKFDNIDRSSDYYRYPITKNEKITKNRLFVSGDIVPDLSKNIMNHYVLCDENNLPILVLDKFDQKSYVVMCELSTVLLKLKHYVERLVEI